MSATFRGPVTRRTGKPWHPSDFMPPSPWSPPAPPAAPPAAKPAAPRPKVTDAARMVALFNAHRR